MATDLVFLVPCLGSDFSVLASPSGSSEEACRGWTAKHPVYFAMTFILSLLSPFSAVARTASVSFLLI